MSTRTILPAVKFTGGRNPFPIALTLALLLVTGSIILMSSDGGIGPDRTAGPSASGPDRPVPAATREVEKSARTQPRLDTEEKTHGLGFSPGDILHYRFERRRELTIAAMAAPGSDGPDSEAQSVSLVDITSGILSLRVYEELAAGWMLGFEFSEVETIVESAEVPGLEPATELSQEMNVELLALLEPSGRFRKLVFPSAMGPDARNSVKDLLALFQVILPGDESKTEWKTEEEDTTGTYLASYRRKKNENGTGIIKTRLGYTSVEAAETIGESMEAMTESDGRTEILLDPLPVSIVGAQRLWITLDGPAQGMSSVVTCRFEREELARSVYPSSGPAAERLLAAAGTTLRAEPRPESEALSLAADVPDTVEILRDIRGLINESGIESATAATAMAQLVEAIKRDDKAVVAVLEKLAEASCGEDEASLLIGALGAAGTVAAQDGLEEIITAGNSPVERQEIALFAFAQVESPREGIDETLRDIYEEKGELWNTSLLLLGAVGDRVRSSDPERFEMTADYLLEAYRSAGERGERAAILESIGNLALEATPREVAEAYADTSDRIRRAAVRSLRRTFDSAAEEILLHAFESDTSEAVRAAAAKTLAEFPHEADDGFLRRSLPGETSERVRRDLLAGLARRERFDDGARDLVDWIAGNDPSSDIRDYAEKLLR